MGGEPVLGWKLDRLERDQLLARFVPRYALVVADHVTFGRQTSIPPIPVIAGGTIIGRADDGEGVEAMVVKIAGTSDRWDSSTYHITWSLGPGRKAVESNAVIADCGWQSFDEPVSLSLTQSQWP